MPYPRQLRVDCYGKRVRVTEICPCRVATDIFGNVSGDHEDARKRFIEGFELPQASDIADCVAFAAPVAVNIGNIEIMPTLQVPRRLVHYAPSANTRSEGDPHGARFSAVLTGQHGDMIVRGRRLRWNWRWAPGYWPCSSRCCW